MAKIAAKFSAVTFRRRQLLPALLCALLATLGIPPVNAAPSQLSRWEGKYRGNVIAVLQGLSYIGPSSVQISRVAGGGAMVRFQGSIRRNDATIPLGGFIFFRDEANFSTSAYARGGVRLRSAGTGTARSVSTRRLIFATSAGGLTTGSIARNPQTRKLTLRYRAFRAASPVFFRFNVRP